MDTSKVGPCSNCGGNAYTTPSKVGIPSVTIDETKNTNVDFSKVLTVDIIVCHKCGNIKFFKD